jgi:hypothetical protein
VYPRIYISVNSEGGLSLIGIAAPGHRGSVTITKHQKRRFGFRFYPESRWVRFMIRSFFTPFLPNRARDKLGTDRA